MSKWVKDLMRSQLADQFRGVDGGVFISTQGLNSEKTYAFRAALNAKKMRYTVLRNAMACQAFASFGYSASALAQVLKGPIGVVTCDEEGAAMAAARVVADWKLETRDKVIEWKGAFVDGEVVGAQEAEDLKNAPTKDQARAMLLGLIQAPATQLLGTVREPCARVAYLLKAFADKREEAGEKAE